MNSTTTSTGEFTDLPRLQSYPSPNTDPQGISLCLEQTHPRRSRYALVRHERKRLTDGTLDFFWEVFDGSTSAFERQIGSVLHCAQKLTSIMGVLGVRIVRVTSRLTLHNHYLKWAHLWSTDLPSKGIAKSLAQTTVMVGLVPIFVSLLVTCLPLHELRKPVGTDGFLSAAASGGWMLQASINVFLASCIFFGMQCLYLNQTDHFYFRAWPSFVHLFLFLIVQDIIPRALGVFPVPFLFNSVGAVLVVAVVLANSYDFVTNEMPKYERGVRKPSTLEWLISGGRNTARERHFVQRRMKRATNTKGVGGRPRSYSLPTTDDAANARERLPGYIVFRRRRLLTLFLIIGVYAVFYWICVTFLLLFRLWNNSDTLQAAFAITFSLVSATFRKFLVPWILEKAKFGGRLWDGKFYDRFLTQRDRYDDRLNTSAFRLTDFFYESLSEVFITFILPEATSIFTVLFLIVGEVFIILFTGASWILMLPVWRKKPKSTSVLPEASAPKREKGKGYCGVGSKRKDKFQKWASACSRLLTGVPSSRRINFLNERLQEGGRTATTSAGLKFSHSRDMTPVTSSWARLALLTTRFPWLPNHSCNIVEALKCSKESFDASPHWHTMWLVSLVTMAKKRPSSSHTSGLVSRSKDRRRNSVGRLERYSSSSLEKDWDAPPSKSASKGHTSYMTRWYFSDPRTELTVLAWIISRCQTLFVMFMANIYAGVSFLVMFSFMVQGHNRKSFPYTHICDDQFLLILFYDFCAICAVLLGIGMVDFFLRKRLGISLVSVGTAYVLSHVQAMVPVVLTGIISYSLVWSFLVDHANSLLYFTSRFGEFSNECE
eukprot:gb/GECG01002462.1/.p1 GENE.gb/GECG01002462.1/~~gb/GECG01002462.1/.p1  ORF type:complete len:830 (+),score=34.05 gb/GECG01002462.1/:1-2490(+)